MMTVLEALTSLGTNAYRLSHLLGRARPLKLWLATSVSVSSMWGFSSGGYVALDRKLRNL